MAYVKVVAASTSNVNVLNAPLSLDGVSLIAGVSRVLLTNQTPSSQNGVWVFQGGGPPATMARPADATDPYHPGNSYDNATLIWVTNGNTLAGTVWGVDPAKVITVDTTNHALTQVSLPPVLARAATTANISLSAMPPNIDGVTNFVSNNGGTGSDVVLVKDQTIPSQNGLYWANTVGSAMQRTTEPLPPTLQIHVSEGTINAHTRHELVTQGAITLDTTALGFAAQNLVFNVRDFGARGDGVTDDTAAIQTALNQFATGAPLAGSQNTLYFPSGTYKVSNTLVYEGDNGTGLRMLGGAGPGYGHVGASIAWFGPLNFGGRTDNMGGGTVMLVLGANNMTFEQLNIDPSPPGGGKAQVGLWIDATNTTTQTPPPGYTISSITRSGNVVTATIGAHTIASPFIIKVAGYGGVNSSFNGTFRVLYSDLNNTVSWMQGGSDTTVGGGAPTVTKYQSEPSNRIILRQVGIFAAKAVATAVTSLTGPLSTLFTLTTTSPHLLNAGDLVVYKGGTNQTYFAPYTVTAVASSTTATLIAAGALAVFPDNNNSTGGTIYSDATGLRIAHRDALTPEAGASLTGYDLFFLGDGLGSSICALKADDSGNVKDFEFFNVDVAYYRYGFYGFNSGNFSVVGYTGALSTPDTLANLCTIDFFQVGPALIASAETENTNNRFVSTTLSSEAPIRLDSVSVQGSAPTDDRTLMGNSFVITGSQFFNTRTTTSVPLIGIGNPLFGLNGGSLVSLGNFYSNTAPSGSGPSPGYVPVVDGGGSNIFHKTGGSYYDTHAVNIMSRGDYGSSMIGGGNPTSLNNVDTLSYLAIGDETTRLFGLPDTGAIRMTTGAAIIYRKNNIAGNVQALIKGTDDVVTVGDVQGVGITSNLRTKTAANTDLAGELTLTAATSVTYAWIGTYASHPEAIVTPQFNLAGVNMWVTYTGTTSFTVNFSSAVTGTVSYHAIARN